MQAYVQCCGICATFYKLLFYIADTAHTLLQFPQIAGFKKLPNYVTGHTFALRGDNHPVVILTVAMCWIICNLLLFCHTSLTRETECVVTTHCRC